MKEYEDFKPNSCVTNIIKFFKVDREIAKKIKAMTDIEKITLISGFKDLNLTISNTK